METRKVCRVLIIIFAFLSLLFYFLYTKEFDSKSVLTEDFVNSAVKNLSLKDVDVKEHVINREIPENNIYVFDVSSFDKHHESVIDAILETAFDKPVSAEYFNVPDGVAVGMYDAGDSTKELGRVLFYDSDFKFSFSKNGINFTGGDEPVFSSDTEELPEFALNTIEKIINTLNGEGNCSYRIFGASDSDEIYAVSIVQTIDGKDINDVFLNLIFENEQLVLLEGNWITENPKPKYHNSLVDGINALYMLDFDNVSEIVAEKIVYFIRKGENDRYFLVPEWEISYSDKSGYERKEYVDAL